MTTLTFKTDNQDALQNQANKLTEAAQFNSIEWRLTQQGTVHSQGSVATESTTLPTDAPLYRIYSMTKPIVSFVAMQLIAEGNLKLDDAVSQYIPAMATLQVLNNDGSLEALQTEITIEHLLTHTAGFSYDFLPNCAIAERYRKAQLSSNAERSLAEVIGMLTTIPLAYQPGQQWRYSVATDVLAHVLENVTGVALPELLATRIFEPLGMQDTAFYVAQNKLHRLLPMYGSRELGQVMVDSDEPNRLNLLDVDTSYPAAEVSGFYRGGHGLFSTLADYEKFIHVLQTGQSIDGKQLLSNATLELMWSDRIADTLQPLVVGFNVMSGYGWNLMGRVMINPEQAEFATVMGEGGWAGAASTYFWIDRSNGISGIAMSQYIGSTQPLGALMQHAAFGMFEVEE